MLTICCTVLMVLAFYVSGYLVGYALAALYDKCGKPRGR